MKPLSLMVSGKQKIILGIVFILSAFSLNAKTKTEAKIDSIQFIETTDITARRMNLKDANGEACALIKVSIVNLNPTKLNFSGSSILKKEMIDNSIWLWVLDGTRKIEVSSDNMHPVEIIFASFGYPSLHGKTTYNMNITVGYVSEKEVYKEVVVEKERFKTKYVDTFEYDEAKTYYFLTYQYEYGYPFGLNFGVCKKIGVYGFLNYIDSSIQFAFEDDTVDDGSERYRHLVTFGVGPMFRLSSHCFLQIGIGLSTDGEDTEWYMTVGGSFLFKFKRLIIGAGYYYNGASPAYNRDSFLDGLSAHIGICF